VILLVQFAHVAELADACASGAHGETLGGSNPLVSMAQIRGFPKYEDFTTENTEDTEVLNKKITQAHHRGGDLRAYESRRSPLKSVYESSILTSHYSQPSRAHSLYHPTLCSLCPLWLNSAHSLAEVVL
jgi:hypothetical protein